MYQWISCRAYTCYDSVKQYRKCECKVLQYYCNIVFKKSWTRTGAYTINESGSQERENWFGTWSYREIQG